MRSAHAMTMALASSVATIVQGSFDLSTLGNDDDLTHFVTRPEIKAPILDVINYDASVASGYFFVAPYARIYKEQPAAKYYQPCQVGPHIYDVNGELVWSGACAGSNDNVADFRPLWYQNSYHLSLIRPGLQSYVANDTENAMSSYGSIMSGSYIPELKINPPKDAKHFAMFDLTIVNEGRSALSIIRRPELRDLSAHPSLSQGGGWVTNSGFQEVDTATGDVRFEWRAFDHVDIADSTLQPVDTEGPPSKAWDFFGANSIDKDSKGDYLLSARYMDAIYRISGRDGSIQWQLGGKSSSLHLQGFNFSRQHDARILNPAVLPFDTKKDMEYISFVDNAADEKTYHDESTVASSTLIVQIDRAHKHAKVIHRVMRPDGEATTFGGNTHFLPNGHLLTSWAGDAYITEHQLQGEHSRPVMQARFLSDRFTTYRAYKADFEGMPSEPPALKCTAFGTSAATATVVCHVSWNGATEVRRWRFREATRPRPATEEVLGSVGKSGFESRIQFQGYVSRIYAEAIGVSGKVLGVSPDVEVVKAIDWTAAVAR